VRRLANLEAQKYSILAAEFAHIHVPNAWEFNLRADQMNPMKVNITESTAVRGAFAGVEREGRMHLSTQFS
jgi:hypothetical protein